VDTITKNSQEGAPREIRARTFAYALRAVKLYQDLQKKTDGAAWILGKQYIKAATSIGANLADHNSELIAVYVKFFSQK